MRLRFKSILLFLFLLIVACASVGVGYLFYIKVIHNDAVVIVDGVITINYSMGNEFEFNKDTKIEFSVTNNSSEQAYYYIQLTDIKNSDNVKYNLVSETNNLNISNDLKSDIISNYVAIDGNKTDKYEIEFKTENSEAYSGKIVVGIKQNENNTFADIILKNNQVNETNITSFGESAIQDEGLIQSTDSLGITYYYRGNVINNYVSFAGFTWRILRINGDGSVKLVLNELVDVLTRYYDDNAYYFDESAIYEHLNSWYKSNLENYADLIANYKYCNDLIYDEPTNTYGAYNRIVVDKIPTFVCLGAEDNGKIGLLTADEVMLAGASLTENKSYFLYNENITTDYYTMTSAKFNNNIYMPFIVRNDGALTYNTAGNLLRGARPVINIIRNTAVTGTGTSEDPYILNLI